MPSNATWFRLHVPKCSQMRHGFDNMFQNAFKCDMVSTTCSKMLSNATWFRHHVPKCSQMRHSFDNMFQNAFKCDMVSTTCSKMPSNATWFGQHVLKCSQMRHDFDNMFQTYQTYQPTNLHLYLYWFLVQLLFCWVLALGPGPSSACTRVLCMHKSVVHAQEINININVGW